MARGAPVMGEDGKQVKDERGKPLMSLSEIAVMPGGKYIFQLQGLYPFYSDKYDITAHPRYKYLSGANPKNTFNPEQYLSRLRRATATRKPEDVFTVVDVEDDTENPAVN